MSGDDWIKGYCPVGCGPTLKRRPEDDRIVCQDGRCPRPYAVSELLDDQETEHIVLFSVGGFTIRHPLRERLGDDLLRCMLNDFLGALSASPVPNGRYRVTWSKESQTYLYEFAGQQIDDHETRTP